MGKDGTSPLGGEIMKSGLREAGLTRLASAIEPDGLARQPLAPVGVGRVGGPPVSPLLRAGGGGEGGGLQQEGVFVRPRAEAREFRETLGGPGRRDPGRRFYEIEHVDP